MLIAFEKSSGTFHLHNDRVSYVIRLAAGRYPFNIFDGQEKDELIVIIKRCHCVPILIKKYRLC